MLDQLRPIESASGLNRFITDKYGKTSSSNIIKSEIALAVHLKASELLIFA